MTIPNGYNFGVGRPSIRDYPLSSRVNQVRSWNLPQEHASVNRESRAQSFKITPRQSSQSVGSYSLLGTSIRSNYDRFLERFDGQGQPIKYDFGKSLGYQFESIPSIFYYSTLVNDEFVREEAHILAEFNYVPLNKGIQFEADSEQMLNTDWDESHAAKEWRRNSESRHWRTWVATCIMLETMLGDEVKEEGAAVNSSPLGRRYSTYEFAVDGEDPIVRNDLMQSGVQWESLGPQEDSIALRTNAARDNVSVLVNNSTLSSINPQMDAKVIPFVRNLIRTYSTMYLADEIFLKNVAGYPYYAPGRHAYEIDTDLFKDVHAESLQRIMGAIKDSDLKKWVRTHALNYRDYEGAGSQRGRNSSIDRKYRDIYDRKIISLQNICWPENVDSYELPTFSLRIGTEPRRAFKLAPNNRKNFIRNTTSSLRHIWSYLKRMKFDSGVVRSASARNENSIHFMNAIAGQSRTLEVNGSSSAATGLSRFTDGASYYRAMKIRRIIFNAYADMKTGIDYNISSISSADNSPVYTTGASSAGQPHVDDVQKLVAQELEIDITGAGSTSQEFSKTKVVFCPYLIDDSYFQWGESETRVVTARDLLRIKKKYLERLISDYPYSTGNRDLDTRATYSNMPGQAQASEPLEAWMTKYGPQHFFELLENFIIRLCPIDRIENPSGASDLRIDQFQAFNDYRFDLARGCVLLAPENIVAHIGKRKIGKFLFDLSLNYEFYANLYDLDNNPNTGEFGGADYAPGNAVGDFQPSYAIKIYDNELNSAARTEEQIVSEFTSNHNDQDPSIFSVSQTLEAFTTMVQPTLSFAVGGSFPSEILSLVNSSIIKTSAISVRGGSDDGVLDWHRKVYVFFCVIMQITTDIAEELVDGKMPYFSREFRSNSGSFEGQDGESTILKNSDIADQLFDVFRRKHNRTLRENGPQILVPSRIDSSLDGLTTGEMNISDLNYGQLLDIINHHREALVTPTVNTMVTHMFESMENWQESHGSLPNSLRDKINDYDQVLEQALFAITGTHSDTWLRNHQDTVLDYIERFFGAGTEGSLSYYEVFRNYMNRKKAMGLGDGGDTQRRRDTFTARNSSANNMYEQRSLLSDQGGRTMRVATEVYGVGAGGLPVASGFLGVNLSSEIKEKIIDNFKNKLLTLDRNTNILVLFSEFICGQLFYGIDPPAGDISSPISAQQTSDEAFEKNWGLSDYEENTKGILNYVFREFINNASNEDNNEDRAPDFMHFPVVSSQDLYNIIWEYIEICDSYCINLPNVDVKFENTVNDRFNSGAGSTKYVESASEAIVTSSGETPADLVSFSPISTHVLQDLTNISRTNAGNLHQASTSDLKTAVDQLNDYMNRANDYFRRASKMLSVEPTFRMRIIPKADSSSSEDPGAPSQAPKAPIMNEFSKINSLGFLPHISLSTPYFRKWVITNEMKNETNLPVFNMEVGFAGEYKVIDEVYPGLNLYSKVGIEKRFKKHRTTNSIARRNHTYEDKIDLSHASIPQHLNYREIHDDLRQQIQSLVDLNFGGNRRPEQSALEYPHRHTNFSDTQVAFYKNHISQVVRQPFKYREISTFYGYPVNAFKTSGVRRGPESLYESNRPEDWLLTNLNSSWSSRTLAPPPPVGQGAISDPPQHIVDNRNKIVETLTSQPALSDEYARFLAENVFEDYLSILPAGWYAELYRKFPPIVAVESKKDEILVYESVYNDGFPIGNEFSNRYGDILEECSNDTIKGTIVDRKVRKTSFRCVEFNYRLRKVKYKFHRAFGWSAAEPTTNTEVEDLSGGAVYRSENSDMPGGLHLQHVNSNDSGHAKGLVGAVSVQGNGTLYPTTSGEIYWMPLWSKMGDSYSTPDRPSGTDQSLRDVWLNYVNPGDIVNLKVRAKNFPHQMSKMTNLFQYMEKYQPTSTNQHSIGVKQFSELHYDLLFNGGRYSAYMNGFQFASGYQKNMKNFYRMMNPRFAYWSPTIWIGYDSRGNIISDQSEAHSTMWSSQFSRDHFNGNNSNFLSRVSSCWGAAANPLSFVPYLGSAGSKNWPVMVALAQAPATLLEWFRSTAGKGPLRDLEKYETESNQFDAAFTNNTATERKHATQDVYLEFGGKYNFNSYLYDAKRKDDFQELQRGANHDTSLGFIRIGGSSGDDTRTIEITYSPEGNARDNFRTHIESNFTKFEYYYAKAKSLWLQNHDPVYSEYGSTAKHASIPDCAKFIPTNNSGPATFSNGFDSNYKFYDHYLGQSSRDLFINGFAYAAPYSAKCPWAPAFDSEYRNISYHDAGKGQEDSMGFTGYGQSKCVAKFGGSAEWCSHFYDPFRQDPHQKEEVFSMFSLPDGSSNHGRAGNKTPLINRSSNFSELFVEVHTNDENAAQKNLKRAAAGDRFHVAYERVNYVEQLQPVHNWTNFDWSNVGNIPGESANISKYYALYWESGEVRTPIRSSNQVPGKDATSSYISYDNQANINTARMFNYAPTPHIDIQHGDPTKAYDPVWKRPGDVWWTSFSDVTSHFSNDGSFSHIHAPTSIFSRKYGCEDFLKPELYNRVKVDSYFPNDSRSWGGRNGSRYSLNEQSEDLITRHPPLYIPTNRFELLVTERTPQTIGDREDFGSPLLDPKQDLMFYWHPGDNDSLNYERIYYKYKEVPITNARSMFMTMNDTITEDNPYLYRDVDFCKFRTGFFQEELPERNTHAARVPKVSYQQHMTKMEPSWGQFESLVPEFELYNRSKEFTHPGEGLIKTRWQYDQGTDVYSLRDNYASKKIYLSKDQAGNYSFWSTDKVPEEFNEVPASQRFKLKTLAELRDYTVSIPLKRDLKQWYKLYGAQNVELSLPLSGNDGSPSFDKFYIQEPTTSPNFEVVFPKFVTDAADRKVPVVSYIGQKDPTYPQRPHTWTNRQKPIPAGGYADSREPDGGFEVNYTVSDNFEAPIGEYLYKVLQAKDDLFEPDSAHKYFAGHQRNGHNYKPFSERSSGGSTPWGKHANHWNLSTDVDSRIYSKNFADQALDPQHSGVDGIHRTRAKYPLLGQVRFHEHEVHGVSHSKFHTDMALRVEEHNKVNKLNALNFFKEISFSLMRYQAYAWKVIGGGNSIQFQPRFAKNNNANAKSNNQPLSQHYLMWDDMSRLESAESEPIFASREVQAQKIGYRSSMNWVGGEWRGSWDQADAQNWAFKDTESGFTGITESHQINYAGLLQNESPLAMRTSRFHTYNLNYDTFNSTSGVASRGTGYAPNREKVVSSLPVMKTAYYPHNLFAKYFVPINSQGTFGELDNHGFSGDIFPRGTLGTGYLIRGDFTIRDPLFPSVDERNHAFSGTRDILTPIGDISERNLAGLSGRDYNDARTERTILTKIPCIQSWDEEHPLVEFDIRIKSTNDTLPPDVYYDLDYTRIANLNPGLNPGTRFGGYTNSFEKLSVASNVITAVEKLEDHYLQHLLSYQKYITKFEAAHVLNSKYYCELLQNVTWDVTSTIQQLDRLDPLIQNNSDSVRNSGFGRTGDGNNDADSAGNIARAALAPMFRNLGFSNLSPSTLSNWATMGELLSKQRFDPDAAVIHAGTESPNNAASSNVSLPAITKLSAYSLDDITFARWSHSAVSMFKKFERHIFAEGKLKSDSRIVFAGILSGQLSKLYDSAYNLTREVHKDFEDEDSNPNLSMFNNPIAPYVNLEIELIDNFRPWITFSKLKKSFVLNNTAYGNISKFGATAHDVTAEDTNAQLWETFGECFTNVNYPNILLDTTTSFMFSEFETIPREVVDGESVFDADDDNSALGVTPLQTYFGEVEESGKLPKFGNFEDAYKNSLLDLYLKVYANKVLGLEMNQVLIPDSKVEDFIPDSNTDASFGERDYTELLKFNCKLLIENLSKTVGETSEVISRRRKFMKYFFERQEIRELQTITGEREYQEFDRLTSRNEVFPTRLSDYSIFESDVHNLTLNSNGEVLGQQINDTFRKIVNDDQILSAVQRGENFSDLQRKRALSDINYLFEILSPESLTRDSGLFLEKLQPFKFKEPITENSLRAAEILTSVNETYRTISDFAIDYRCGFKFDYIVGTSYSLSDFRVAGFRDNLDGVTLETSNCPGVLTTYLGDRDYGGDTPYDFFREDWLSTNIINNIPYLEYVDGPNGEKHIKINNNAIQPLSIRIKFVK